MFKRNNYVFLILLIAILGFFMSCDSPTSSDNEESEESLSLSMSFTNINETSSGLSRTTAGDQYIGNFEIYDNAYASLGNQIDFSGSVFLSPSSFVLPFTQAALSNGVDEINLSVPVNNYPESEWNDVSNVDFCQPREYEIEGDINSATYNTIFMRITSTQRKLGWGDGGEIWETPILEVTVPGYTNVEWPDKELNGFFLRKYLGDNKFQFDLSEVLPVLKDVNDATALPVENYLYCSDYTSPGVILPGLEGFPETINTNDFGYVLSGSTGTNLSMLLFPFEEVELSGETTLVFYVETENLLTVYDNGSADKADHQLILVKDYWSHFGVRTE